MVQAQAARKVASCGDSLDVSTQTTAAGSPAPFSTPSLDYSFRGVQVYPDGRLTAGYSTRLGVDVGAKAVLASMHVEVPNDDNFADADHVVLGMMLPATAGLLPRHQHLWYARCVDIGQPMLPDERQY